jgi:hypothetical protein
VAKGVFLNSNELVDKYFNGKDFFTVTITPRLEGAVRISMNTKGEVAPVDIKTDEKPFTLIYSRESYSVSHGHSWDRGGTLEAGVANFAESVAGLFGGVKNAASLFASFKDRNIKDARSVYAAVDAGKTYSSSDQRTMSLSFMVFRYEGEGTQKETSNGDRPKNGNNVTQVVNYLRNLTYPGISDKSDKSGTITVTAQPPHVFRIECSNGTQGFERAACNSMDVTYYGPWMGPFGDPSYAEVVMNFVNLKDVTLVGDFDITPNDPNP